MQNLASKYLDVFSNPEVLIFLVQVCLIWVQAHGRTVARTEIETLALKTGALHLQDLLMYIVTS